ncbi:bifunctional diguanylate cyclase/phosphodiesterase [Eubacterium sp. 1001713B170207_170306_E7]|uniref:putative bifunctional diguanylate cyclase/phosphodiesterase n=1 Tax=Eubacterium sp. 1001713B170207_170306_E7 TaxID=2787097 RepID=UPI0018998E30|nr:bifunctional diguanylate cyclase/phosphodiesterase [Eubacterium sp. 1001713B170207_170306_E7]
MENRKNIVLYTVIWLVGAVILLFFLFQNAGDSRIINYTGIVRGATQKLVKNEISGDPNAPLMDRLDGILYDLQTGDGDYQLNKCGDSDYQAKLLEIQEVWKDIKLEIDVVRSGTGRENLYQLSEQHFKLSDQAVSLAEQYSDRKLYRTFIILIVYILVSSVWVIFRERKRYKDFRQIYYHDTLTGIPNYLAFIQGTETILNRRDRSDYIIVNMDIDDFKYINDLYGYQMGDNILRNIGFGLSKKFEGELCARVSANNFIILTKKTQSIDKEIRDYLNQLISKKMDFLEKLSFSFGIYKVEAGEESVEAMIDKSAFAHKIAKNGKRATTVWYDEALLEQLTRETRLTKSADKALEMEEFKVYLQPKVDILSGSVIGAEALVRWVSQEYGFLPPDEFIPLFESNGFITKLDFYMLEKVCLLVRQALDDPEKTALPVSVNFSRITVRQMDFVRQFQQIVETYNIPPCYVEAEVTESAFGTNPEKVVKTMEVLQKNGFLIVMDDFGAGYSSLNLLMSLPIDVLKLDKEFLLEGTSVKRAQIIIKNIVDMAEYLGIQVVCEGVETEEHLRFLKEIGCEIGQGYYFSKPLPVSAFREKYHIF